jgi:cytochrome c
MRERQVFDALAGRLEAWFADARSTTYAAVKSFGGLPHQLPGSRPISSGGGSPCLSSRAEGRCSMIKAILISAVALAASSGIALAGDPAAGQTVFKKCMPCHRIGEGAKNLVGPELNGIDGRHSGSAPGYHYSAANEGSGIVWNEATFKEYIKDPRAKIPGTKMIFPGIKSDTDADNLWSYLKQFGPDGKPKS